MFGRSHLPPQPSFGDRVRESSGDAVHDVGLQVLWVDDRPREIGGLAQYLRLRHCEVEVVETEGAALSALRRLEPDFLILDWKLLNGTAEPILEACRREHSDLPVLVLTGYATPDLEAACLRLGAVRFREKPIHGEDLLALVRHHARPAWWPYRWTWTQRACELLSPHTDAGDGSESDHRELADVARRFARSLADDDISIPEVLAGSRVLSRVSATRARGQLPETAAHLASLSFDCRHLPPPVVGAIRVFETWTPGSPLPTEEDLACLVQPALSRSRFSELVWSSTRLHILDWKLGARLRHSIRRVVGSESAMKAIAPDSGWSSPEQFSRGFRDALGMSPSEFRAFVSVADSNT